MTVALDHMAALVEAYDKARDEEARWAEAAEVLAKRIQAEMGDADVATLAGREVFTWKRTGQFAAKRFTIEQSEVAAKYTRPVTRDELDVNTLKTERPDLYIFYRARRFERKRKP